MDRAVVDLRRTQAPLESSTVLPLTGCPFSSCSHAPVYGAHRTRLIPSGYRRRSMVPGSAGHLPTTPRADLHDLQGDWWQDQGGWSHQRPGSHQS